MMGGCGGGWGYGGICSRALGELAGLEKKLGRGLWPKDKELGESVADGDRQACQEGTARFNKRTRRL